MSSPARRLRVGLRCDAGPRIGVGHAVRLLALAEELRARGSEVVLLGRVEVAWLRDEYAAHDIELIDPPSEPARLAALATDHRLDAVVLDRYDLDATTGATLRAAGLVVLAMVDDEFGAAQQADLYVDQNLGARPRSPRPEGSRALAGIEYALFRDSVLDRVHAAGPVRATGTPARVLAVFGGTDPFGAAPVLAPLVLATGHSVELTVVAPDLGAHDAIGRLGTLPGQSVRVVPALRDLAATAASSDLVVSASGSSVWEMLCLGVPTATVCVVDNQEPGYRESVRRGVTVGLGRLDDLRGEQAAGAIGLLRDLLSDPAERLRLATAGRALVDGRGRARVVDALTERLDHARHSGA